MKKTCISVLILLVSLVAGCQEEDPVLDELMITEKNFPKYIEMMRTGYQGRRRMPSYLGRETLLSASL
ncbi:hypothetical protein Spirs_1770 [Sediminispirochaeta smaragdinae DSM 11293]|uniref:Lipoprotein n=1 Tax=Sediminispirochaeta smaragdinae (strain DSM 11293 / JCM 15392 / SEBR 4228) TaxID=573413 RepID=E1R176_SEDSS|nr:hypothetical protein Spirs_1770 [Sediminispirochaeta smaragdinae DSM 11293]